MPALFAPRTYVVVATACILGFGGGALLAAVEAPTALFFALGTVLAGLSAVQTLRPGVGVRAFRARPQTQSDSDLLRPDAMAEAPTEWESPNRSSQRVADSHHEGPAARACLVAVAFHDLTAAQEIAASTAELQQAREIELDDMMIVERKQDGRIKLHQQSLSKAGAAGGALWGGLIGMIFFMPLLGMAVGAAAGTAAGPLSDHGIDDKFMKELGASLQTDHAALVLLIPPSSMDKLVPRLETVGHVIQARLTSEQVQALDEALYVAGE